MNTQPIIKNVNIKSKEKETWLDTVPSKAILDFAIENIQIEKVEGLSLSRYYVGNTKTTSMVTLLQYGKPIYDFLPYVVTKTENCGIAFELNDLQKNWMLFVAQYNENRVINGKSYYEDAADYVAETFEQDEEVENFIQSLELVNLL